MTRNLTIACILSLVLVVLLFVGGLASNSPLLLMPALLCAFPSFFFCLGAAIGRASNEYQVVKKAGGNQQARIINSRTQRPSENLG